MKKCPSCNSYNDDLNAICEYCGAQFPNDLGENPYNENDNQSSYNNSGRNNYNNQNNFDMRNYRTTEQDKAGVEALVFGILSLFCCAIIFGPLAVVRGNESRCGLGTAGKVLGIVGMCLWALGFLLRLFS